MKVFKDAIATLAICDVLILGQDERAFLIAYSSDTTVQLQEHYVLWIAQRLDFLGAVLDEDRNRDAAVNADSRVAEISVAHARCPLLVVATDEELAIAAAVRRLGIIELMNSSHSCWSKGG